MATHIDRRNLLAGEFLQSDVTAMRPPGAASADFEAMCTACSACGDACPEDVIIQDKSGRPTLSLDSASCTFCSKCIESCPTDALDQARLEDWAWKARVTPSCMSLNGITCRVCEDACHANAIRFRLEIGGKSNPNIAIEACTGCGGCAVVCPSQSIEFVQIAHNSKEAVA